MTGDMNGVRSRSPLELLSILLVLPSYSAASDDCIRTMARRMSKPYSRAAEAAEPGRSDPHHVGELDEK